MKKFQRIVKILVWLLMDEVLTTHEIVYRLKINPNNSIKTSLRLIQRDLNEISQIGLYLDIQREYKGENKILYSLPPRSKIFLHPNPKNTLSRAGRMVYIILLLAHKGSLTTRIIINEIFGYVPDYENKKRTIQMDLSKFVEIGININKKRVKKIGYFNCFSYSIPIKDRLLWEKIEIIKTLG